ncbi:MAG: hypothetical protein H7Y43_14300 [Akkermansiaceae bacterium]|nr:hypothetical protein [Verrucomicrobiales bacterium]
MKASGDGDISIWSKWTFKLVTALVLGAAALTANGQPANDDFANRISIGFGNTNFSGSLSNATSEANEPFQQDVSSGQTAWWSWSAPSNGIVRLTFNGTNFSPFLNVYSGDNLVTLSLVASNTYLSCYESTECGCHWRFRNQISFHVFQGSTYAMQLDSGIITDASFQGITELIVGNPGYSWFSWAVHSSTNVLGGAGVTVELKFAPAPANDNFSNPIPLQGNRTRVTASNHGAGRESGEPAHLGNSGGSSVWYSWTAPASGRVTLSINNIPPYQPSYVYGVSDQIGGNWLPDCGDEIDQNPPPVFFPLFAAYTGTSVGSLVSANAYPLQIEAYPYAVGFDVVKGQTYRIAFDGNRGTTGTLPLYLALTKPASNDDFNKRISLRGIYAVATGFNAGATRQPGEPLVPTNTLGKSVWWSWTAPVSGTVTVDVAQSQYGFPVAVFTGNKLTSLTRVSVGEVSTSFTAVAGQTYQIAVLDWQGVTGGITLRLTAPVVEADFRGVVRFRNKTLLSYAALRGQKLLLQKQVGNTWQNVETSVAHNSGVTFLVKEKPTEDSPIYRAIIVDWMR